MRVNIRPRGFKKFNRKLEGHALAGCSFPQDVWDSFYYDGDHQSFSKKSALFIFLQENEVDSFVSDSTGKILDHCISWSRAPLSLKIGEVYHQEKAITYKLMGYIAWLICRGDNSEELIEKLKEQFPQYLPPSYA
jgi:hypothetical protein